MRAKQNGYFDKKNFQVLNDKNLNKIKYFPI